MNDRAQSAVVEIKHAPPTDPSGIDPQLIPPVNVVVHHGRQEIVSRCYGVKITGEMKVDIFHGDDLGMTAARGAALHTETGT